MVREVDSEGRLVQLDKFTPPPLPSPPPPNTTTPTSSTACATPTVEGSKTVRTRPDPSKVPPLNELITQEQYKSLLELSNKMKMTLDPQLRDSVFLGKGRSSCRLKINTKKLFSAGEIADKEKRANVHNAVRLAFPVLMTKTRRSKEVYYQALHD